MEMVLFSPALLQCSLLSTDPALLPTLLDRLTERLVPRLDTPAECSRSGTSDNSDYWTKYKKDMIIFTVFENRNTIQYNTIQSDGQIKLLCTA